MTNREEAEEAVRKLLAYLEEDPNREGLKKTPSRVIDSWDEIFNGYELDASEILDSTFNAEGYDGIVLLRDIEFNSTCEFAGKFTFHKLIVMACMAISRTCSEKLRLFTASSLAAIKCTKSAPLPDVLIFELVITRLSRDLA